MHALRAAIFAGALTLAGCAADVARIPFDSPRHRPATQKALASWTRETLTTFSDEAEFRAYLSAVRNSARARGEYWAFEPADRRPGSGKNEQIIVTGSRILPRNASITNVQEPGVDEGDIVKQIDQFLLVLQDGRLFVADTRPGGAPGLALRDRMDVYRSKTDMWYDEILVHEDRIVVAGYSYDDQVSEFALFRLRPNGTLIREDVFRVPSSDYYDRSNYATRLIDGQLFFYSLIDLTDIDAGNPVAWPRLERVETDAPTPTDAARELPTLYRPAVTALEPAIHAITICPLTSDAGAPIECRSTAFVGPFSRRLYVAPGAAYLWSIPSDEDDAGLIDPVLCYPGRPSHGDNARGALYRIPHGTGQVGVTALRGVYLDHFAMQERDGQFRAVVHDLSVRCKYEKLSDIPRRYFTFVRAPVSAFGPALRDSPETEYTRLPSLKTSQFELADRFTEDYFVLGGLGERHYRPGVEKQPRPDTPIIIVPIREPRKAQILTVPHGVIRAEQAGRNVVLTGYRGPDPLSISLVDLTGPPRIAATLQLEGRYESEGRSHAFNSLIAPDGSGILALPTVPLAADGERLPSWSRPSDVELIRVDANGRLLSAGRLESSVKPRDWEEGPTTEIDGEPDLDSIPGYSCEVSCTDWYGNSRPIFTDGRIFALTATELIEGRVEEGRVREVRRLDLALAKPSP